MIETTSQATSTDPVSPSPTEAPAVAASPTSDQTTTQTPAARPDGVPESFWDKDKGELKTRDWAKSYEELRAYKAAEDARRAALPAQPDLYKPELPKDFQLPKGWELKPDDPLYLSAREIAHKAGLTQEQFSDLVGSYAKAEVAKHEALAAAVKARDESLGENGPQRVDALNKWFTATFGPEVGKQFGNALFTKDMVAGFEKMKDALSRQGVISFSGAAREPIEGRADGKPDNWDTMSSLDRRMWSLQNRGRAA